MPPLLRLLINQVAIGFGIAALLVATLLTFDIGHVAEMVRNSDRRVLAVLVMWLTSGTLFGAIQFAIAVMRHSDDDDDDQDGGHPAYVPISIPLRRDRR